MRRMAVVLVALASVICFSTGLALADTHHDMAKMSATKSTETVGELVDVGCYVGHGSKGEKHTDCAAKCIASGMPMGVLTSSGQLYVLALDHTNPDPYNKAKDMAGKRVKVGGPVHVRNGVKTIDVTSAEVMPAVAASK